MVEDPSMDTVTVMRLHCEFERAECTLGVAEYSMSHSTVILCIIPCFANFR